MRILNLIMYVSAFAFLSNCTSANENRDSSSGSAMDDPDTIVHSFPVNYLATVTKLEPSNKMEISSYKDMMDLFEKLNYTPDSWQAGIREVPRVYLTIVGPNWGSKTTKEITVLNKKQIFFRALAPIVLKSNEMILQDRARLESIKNAFKGAATLSEPDRIFIQNLSKLYKVTADGNGITAHILEELWKRVDMIPPSLALAQGAEESGWGTSRFAAEGNAIYGQWTWGENAIIPEQQRKDLGNYGIAAFTSLQESISAYMLNLNTHNAYAKLRDKRAQLRNKGHKITGIVLAEQLDKYSERGEEYVKGLISLMEYNRLIPADDAYLSAAPPIYLVPAEEK